MSLIQKLNSWWKGFMSFTENTKHSTEGEDSNMNLLTKVEAGFKDVGGFLADVVTGLKKVGALWSLIQSNGTKALILKIASDVLLVVQDTEAAAAAGGLNFVLDEDVFKAGKALIADAEAGNATIIADLAALGITIPAKAATAVAVVAGSAAAAIQSTAKTPAAAADPGLTVSKTGAPA
jgi:hypothetical protein